MVTRIRSEPFASGVHALVLAAGAGTRMGGGKLRRAWRGRALACWALDAALAAPVERVWLVTGADEGIAALAPADERLSVVAAPDWAEGLSASLKAGIAALPETAAAALVFLGDMPRIPAGVSAGLVAAWKKGALAVAPVCEGRRGHPVLLDRRLFPEVMRLEGDAGAGKLLEEHRAEVALAPTSDDGVLFDVDTPSLLDG